MSSIYKYNSQIKRKNEEQSCSEISSPLSPLSESESESKSKSESETEGSTSLDNVEKENVENVEKEHVESCILNSTGKGKGKGKGTVNAGKAYKVGKIGTGTVNLPAGVADLIINYRQEHPGHGYKRIADHLKNRYFVVVPRKKIRELLKLHGLTDDNDSSFDQLSLKKENTGTGQNVTNLRLNFFYISTFIHL